MTSQKIISIWAKVLSENPKVVKKLAEVLKRKKKERFLPAIFKKAAKIYANEKTVELIFARPQSKTLTDCLKKKIQERFGRDKEVVEKVDPALIAGYRAKTNDLILLSSVHDFLRQIKNKLS